MTNKTTHLLIGLLITTALAGGIFAGTVVRDRNVAGASSAQGDDQAQGSTGQARSGGAGRHDDFTPPEARPCTDADTGCGIDLGDDVNISVGDDADITVREDGGFDVSGDVTVPTAAGPVDLIDADLEIGVDENGEPTIVGGTAQVPFPTTGILADAVVNHLPEGLVGIDDGRNLGYLGAHLQDDRQYLYFHFDGGLDIGLPFGGTEGFEAVPSEITVPTGVSATLVLDPSDPYFYIGGPCPSFEDQEPDNDDDRDKDDDRESGRGRQDDDDSSDRQDDDEEDGDDRNDRERGDDPEEPELEDPDALITLEPEGGAPGEDCGIGFSLQGNIPAPTVEGTDPFFGHIVVDGIIPLYAAMELDGTVVLEVREDTIRTSGTGDLSATLPLIDRLIDIQIPLGSAGVDIEAGATRISVGFEGQVGGQDPTYVLPLIDVPVTLPSDGSIELSALLSFTRGADGVVRIDPQSHAEITGQLGLGFGSLGGPLGVDLDNLVTSDAFLRIDPTGFTVQGSTGTNLHPSLATQGRLALDSRIAFDDPAASHLRLDGEVTVAGIALGEAAIDLSRDGLFVAGRVEGIFSEVALAGSIGPGGIDLSGSSSIEFPLDVLERLAQGAIGGIDAAQAEVDELQAEIDALRARIRQERRDRSQDFQAASEALDAAQAEVDVLQRNIDINDDKIADLRRDQAAEIRRYENLSFLEQAAQSIPHLATLGFIEGEIAALTAANVTQAGLHFAATGVLDGAQLLLDGIEAGLDAIPVDTDPRIIALFAAKETATFALQTARTVADAVSIGGTLRGEITWELGTNGLAASLVAEYCDDGCTTLAGGSVRLTPTPEACVEVVGIAEACVAI